MTATWLCANCATVLPTGGPGGLCPACRAAQATVRPPAVGLIVTAALALVLTPAALAAGWDPNYLRFEGGVLMPLVIAVAAVAGLLVLAGAPLALVGGVQMLRLRGPGWAVAGAVVALLPWSPAWPVGLAAGLWALMVMRRPEVRAAFR